MGEEGREGEELERERGGEREGEKKREVVGEKVVGERKGER